MKKGVLLCFVALLVLINGIVNFQSVLASSLTVSTDKPSYNAGEIIHVTVSGGTGKGILTIWFELGGSWKWADQDILDSNGGYNYQLKIPSGWSSGTYKVKVRDDSTGVTAEKSFTIPKPSPPHPPPPTPPPVTNKKPVARAGSDQKIFSGRTLYFDGSKSYDPDGTIASYSWSFGDGTSSHEVRVSHVYSKPGVYTVTLVVVDNEGTGGNDKLNVTVLEPPLETKIGLDFLVEANATRFEIDAMSQTGTIVRVNTTDIVTLTVLQYPGNPHPEAPLPLNSLPTTVDVAVSDPDAVVWPIFVERYYDDADVAGLDESRLVLYYFRDGSWHSCRETGVYTDQNIVWANMFEDEVAGSPILIGVLPREATFELSDLTVDPKEVEPGDEVTISVKITNVGDEPGSHNVTLKINGAVEQVKSVTLDGGGFTTTSFVVVKTTDGEYAVEVDGISDSYKVVSPPPPPPPDFHVSNLRVTPPEVEPGDNVFITVNVSNTGGQIGDYNVTLFLDGEERGSKTVTLDTGESGDVSFTITSEEIGEHTVVIDTESGSFTVVQPPPVPKPFPWMWIDLTIIAVVIAVVYLLRRYKII